MSTTAASARIHPKLKGLFKEAEGRHFNDTELDAILEIYPDLEKEVKAAKAVREVEKKVVKKVVREVFSQYDYEKHHEFALAKCPRDVRYVVAYATHAMLARDHKWFDDKILIWLKTILQSFQFPKRNSSASKALFADNELEKNLERLPQKFTSTFHCYYRIRQEMSRALKDDDFEQMEPYLTQALNTLTEEY